MQQKKKWSKEFPLMYFFKQSITFGLSQDEVKIALTCNLLLGILQ